MTPELPQATMLALLDRYLAGECSASEAERVREWLSADAANHAVLADVERFRSVARSRPPASSADAAWKRAVKDLGLDVSVTREPSQHLRSHSTEGTATLALRASRARAARARTWTWTAIAACLLVAASATMVLRSTRQAPAPAASNSEAREFVTARGQRATIQLVDGSQLILGPASTVHVAADFGVTSRELRLVGEAHFTVHHDAAKPFRVHTSNGTAEDLGTEFVVDAYPESRSTRVIVASGKVALAGTALTRGQMGQLDKTGLVTVASNVDLDSYLSWTQGRLSFRDTPISEAFARLGRWYDLDITIADAKLGKLPLTASFKDESLAQMLKVLDLTLGLTHELRGRKVIFHASAERPATSFVPSERTD